MYIVALYLVVRYYLTVTIFRCWGGVSMKTLMPTLNICAFQSKTWTGQLLPFTQAKIRSFFITELTVLYLAIQCFYIQSTPLNRVTSVRGHFDPIKRRTLLTENILY